MAREAAQYLFGTGADDRAPDDVIYRFYSVRDDDAVGECRSQPKTEDDLRFGRSRDDGKYEWVLGDGLDNAKMPKEPLEDDDAEGEVGERYWSDPLVVDGKVIYLQHHHAVRLTLLILGKVPLKERNFISFKKYMGSRFVL